jgi:UDP:flavonoid glycosyltransferase YjiC (YdhE family)
VVVVPLFADQFENGRRIADAGAGLVVEVGDRSAGGSRRVIDEEDAPRIAHAVEAVLGETSFLVQARTIATEIATAPTPDDVLDALSRGALSDIR